ncbi:potassium channel family protein [Halocatena pleomorpha]|uniref:TrkA family potassium uptake protein n=1 Tax=Halocatena pleomorpha TaxID=1785090 RepID=A0A3P3RA78_9EURY|nr:TrkA family potassium uptake protein [Halocatena pleomorpha]RRJ30377.1 TrkA family potassium uptake protein [Halocatena pleomorpha]
MYLIVVGAGDIGTQLIDIATQSGNEVVVVERDRKRAETAANAFDCLVLNDDATVQDTLIDAGVERADAVISTTDRDATNVMVCLLAEEFDVPNIVSVVHDPDHMNVFERVGANTLQNPQRLIAENLFRSVERPSVVDYMHVGDTAEVFEIRVGEEASVAGKTLSTAANEGIIPDDTLVVAIEREDGDNPITPRGDTHIESGDLVTVYSERGATPEITDLFGHFGDHDRANNRP